MSINAGENVAQQRAHGALKDHIGYSQQYANSWHDNIADAAAREGVPYEVCQRVASKFMAQHFGVETTSPEKRKPYG